jgi:hypothetical protein
MLEGKRTSVNAASWAFGPGYEDQATEIFLAALNLMIGDEESAKAEARSYRTVQRWHDQLRVRTGAAALGTSLIPGLHGGGIVLELPYLLRLMGRGAIGTGELMNAKIEAEADLLAIFALWSGAINKSALAAAAGGVVIVDSIAYPAFGAKVLAVGFKIGVKAATTHAGISVAAGAAIGHAAGKASSMLQPIFGKILAKISAKIAAKIAAHAYAKAVAGLVPFLGACVSTGISLYILNEFLTSATIYYEHKNRDIGTR